MFPEYDQQYLTVFIRYGVSEQEPFLCYISKRIVCLVNVDLLTNNVLLGLAHHTKDFEPNAFQITNGFPNNRNE